MEQQDYELQRVEDGKPIKMWTHGVPVEDDARRQLMNTAQDAVHLPPPGGDARRASGQGLDHRQRDPDAGRDHSGRGRRRHRLRHDGRAHHADRRRPARQPARPAQRDRARRAARPHHAPRRGATRARGKTRPPASMPGWARAAGRLRAHHRKVPAAEEHQQLQAPRHARHRQPLHRGLPGRSRQRVVHAALGFARRRQRHRHLLHRAGAAGHARRTSPTCPTATWPTSRKAAQHFDDYVEAVGWAQDYARQQPRGDDGAT